MATSLALPSCPCSFFSSMRSPAQLRPRMAAAPRSRGALGVTAAMPKAKDLRECSKEELMQMVESARLSMLNVKEMKARRDQDYDRSFHAKLKLQIAQILTVHREMEIAEGMGRRAFTKKQKQERMAKGLGNIAHQ
mmetsp:Transcript_16201/g.48537  ORF Transcript_16201/g.48537 Transcript_16201/m.48537 type:complete len:136 (-) Transcript_16201:144-551(-)|eukprot:CAMPEP_0206150138 /NCGR_PEP_ID=MMETSP1473-20131121/38141_1 /ASSEMBLY_ACC=CAM_ASM_001109 /TAXON_ID=1461547 /ORGANISM="Stichococcus sp, Strain RCC1054" /LENGTH=135 /DNA_ID=CAMNT_0053547631 /DNA_START=89 /DNA_END=496 /DNA_ORIENTATION=-